MKLQSKILTLLASTWLFVMLLIFIGLKLTLTQDYLNLEKNDVQLSLKQVHRTIEGLQNILIGHASDWAHWDDAYSFMSNHNQTFIQSTINADSPYEDANLDFILFFDTKGQLFAGRAFDHATRKTMPISNSLLTYLKQHPSLIIQSNPDYKRGGVIPLPEGFLLTGIVSITTSQGKGPVHGSLLMGYYLNQQRIENLSKTLQTPIQLFTLTQNDIQTKIQKSKNLMLPQSEDNIFGFSYLNDIEGNPVGVLQVDLYRSTYKQGLQSINYYLSITLILGIITLTMMWLLIKKFFLDRLLELNKTITKINHENTFSLRLPKKGNDEIASITKAINDMLQIIELSQEQLKHRLVQSTNQLQQLSNFNKNLSLEIEQHKLTESQLLHEEEKLKQLVYRDSVTGLPNRIYFNEFVEKSILENKNRPFAILFIDIDKFKSINDTYGHDAGDKFLNHLSFHLKNNLREEDLAARLAGDEFIVYLHHVKSREQINSLSKRLIETISSPLVFKNFTIEASVSIGIALYPEDGNTLAELESHADLAMYFAKNLGGKDFYYYNEIKNSRLAPMKQDWHS